MNYLRTHGTRQTPQSQPTPGQVPNSAGGHAFPVDIFERLRRFLILGSEGGSYYASEHKLTSENAACVRTCVSEDYIKTIDEIVAVSTEGRAPKQEPAIFALAMCASIGSTEARRYALAKLPTVCRTGTHLFTFIDFAHQFRGWGRGMRDAVSAWYTEKPLDSVAYQAVKYRSRAGYTHRDVLRLAHPETDEEDRNNLFRWMLGKDHSVNKLPAIVTAFNRAQAATTPEVAAMLVEQNPSLPREALITEHLNDPLVWTALLKNMPMTALIRNLATMTRLGLLNPMSVTTQQVCEQITDQERLTKARVHPIAILAAMFTYKAGFSQRGSNTWTPNTEVVDALDKAFYLAFGNVESAGKRTLIGLDVSGSMASDWSGTIAGVPGLTPRVGAAAMSLVTANAEPQHHIMAFSHQFVPLNISPRQRLDDVIAATSCLEFGHTDCALPMLYAMEQSLPVDTFLVYTDNETWFGEVHPWQALEEYRRKMRIPAKLVVVGMVSNGFTIADPNDSGMLDVVGFDTSTPQVITEFAR